MALTLVENMRIISNKIEEYANAVDNASKNGNKPATPPVAPKAPPKAPEAPKADKTPPAAPEKPKADNTPDDTEDNTDPDTSLDDLLKKPSGADKLLDEINVSKLIEKLNITVEDEEAFHSALDALSDNDPKLTNEQATVLAKVFANLSKDELAEDGSMIQGSQLDLNDIMQLIRNAVDFAPESEEDAKNLVAAIQKTFKNKNEGLDVLNVIGKALAGALKGRKTNVEQMINDVASKHSKNGIQLHSYGFIITTLEKVVRDLITKSLENRSQG